MAKSTAEEIKAGIAKLTAEQKNKIMCEAPGSEIPGKLLSDELVKAELIGKAYGTGPEGLSFEDWVQMKLPSLDKNE